MYDYINYLNDFKNDMNMFFIGFLTTILVASLIDFSLGWINAKFNQNVIFVSSEALYGIIKKMMYFIVLIFFMITSLMIIPHVISIPALIGLFSGYLYSELNSILSHLELTEDGKKGEMFRTFLRRLIEEDKNND